MMPRAEIIARTISRHGTEPTRRNVREYGCKAPDVEIDRVLALVLTEDGWIVEGPTYKKPYKRSKPRPGVYVGSQGTQRRTA